MLCYVVSMVFCCCKYSVVVVCSAICVRVSSGLGKTVRDGVTLGLPMYHFQLQIQLPISFNG